MRTGRMREQGFEPLERKREMSAALVVGDGVDFVHDHGLDVAQDGAALFGGEQDVERFRRGDQNVRRPRQHGAAFVHQGVAGAHADANLGHQQAALGGFAKNFAERDFEIFLDVVAQRLQRRDVQELPSCLAVARSGLCAPAGRCRRERQPASCRSRWARKLPWFSERGCAASPALAARWAKRSARGTIRGRWDAPNRVRAKRPRQVQRGWQWSRRKPFADCSAAANKVRRAPEGVGGTAVLIHVSWAPL